MISQQRITRFEPPISTEANAEPADRFDIISSPHACADETHSIPKPGDQVQISQWSSTKDDERSRIRLDSGKSQSRWLPSRDVPGVRISNSSPWISLTKHFHLMLNDAVVIASRKDTSLVAVREFSGRDADRKVNILGRIRDDHFLAVVDCFRYQESRCAVFEHEIQMNEKLSVTLQHFALIALYPTEEEIAVILEQILDGLSYLSTIGLEHGALTCKNILIGTKGTVKIAGQEGCRELAPDQGSTRDIRGVGYVTMELMHKEARYYGPIKVRDVHRWPLDSKAVQFLLMTEYASSIDELKNNSLFLCKRRNVNLKPSVYLAEFSVFRGYRLCSER